MIARILNKQRQKFQRKHFAPERLPPESKEAQPCLDEIWTKGLHESMGLNFVAHDLVVMFENWAHKDKY